MTYYEPWLDPGSREGALSNRTITKRNPPR